MGVEPSVPLIANPMLSSVESNSPSPLQLVPSKVIFAAEPIGIDELSMFGPHPSSVSVKSSVIKQVNQYFPCDK